MQDRTKIYDPSLAMAVVEEKFYNKLRAALEKLKVQNTVVINGFRMHPMEFDFLIISAELKAIIQIELKKTMSRQSVLNGIIQLNRGLSFIHKMIPYAKDNGWKLIKTFYFESLNEKVPNICHNCQQFILGPDSDFGTWWSDIAKTNFLDTDQSNTYEKAIDFLLHQMFMQKDLLTNTDIIQYSKATNTSWTRSQLELLNDEVTKRVAFTSGYGTGKTTLLKEKAKRILKMKKKVVIILFQENEQDSLLLRCYQQEFRQFEMK